MTTFPRIEQLTISGYELYTGKNDEPLDILFDRGPWILLGVNGLGKSTLLLILRSMLCGRYNSSSGFSGSKSDELRIGYAAKFADRVSDRAEGANAILTCKFGNNSLEITRHLRDLTIISAKMTVGRQTTEITSDMEYKSALSQLMKVSRFEDAVLLLDQIVFKLENRADLLWNENSQYQAFKALLAPEFSHQMRELEGTIVSSDSQRRNIAAQLNKFARDVRTRENKAASAKGTRLKISALRGDLDAAEEQLIDTQDALAEAEQRRLDARDELLNAQRHLEDSQQKYEALKLRSLTSIFAEMDKNTQYTILRLLTSGSCPICGENSDTEKQRLEQRLHDHECVLCGSTEAEDTSNVQPIGKRQQKQIENAIESVGEASRRRTKATSNLDRATEHWESAQIAVVNAGNRHTSLIAQIRKFERSLPKEERVERGKQSAQLDHWRSSIAELDQKRKEAEAEYRALLEELRSRVETIRKKIEGAFAKQAEPFFKKRARLVYVPRKTAIGQMGEQFELPSFEIEFDMSAGRGDYHRRNLDEVSLSQREYLDAIFRMSLLQSCGDGKGATFVFDGPEGSVDAVFARQAGRLFSSFAGIKSKMVLLIACNIIEGDLIPETLIELKSNASKRSRIINLLDIARPTSALEEFREEYDQKLNKILQPQQRGRFHAR